MELGGIYIYDDIFDNIFSKLCFMDKIKLSYVNNYLYNRYHYKIKDTIFKYIHNSYEYFYECIRRFNYSIHELEKLRVMSINDILIVMCSQHTYMIYVLYLN